MNISGLQRSPGRLRWLLIAIVALAVLPVFALYLARLNSSSERALADAREVAMSLARSAAHQQESLVLNARGLSEALRNVPAIQFQSPDCDTLLTEINAKATWASVLFIVNAKGTAVCGSRPSVHGMNFADRHYFHAAIRTGEFVVSEAIIGRVSKQPVVGTGLPIKNAIGQIIGVIVIGIELTWMPSIADVAHERHRGFVLAINRDGGLVTRHQRNSNHASISETGTSDATLRRLVDTRLPVVEFEEDGVGRIFGVAQVNDMQLTVAVGFERSAVLGPIRQRFWTDLFWLLLVAAASAGLALTVAEFSVLRGVRMLNQAALRLKAGKMGVRVNLSPRVATELHDLAASFNSMIAEFERLAYLDRLTGLPNRRYLERQMLSRGDRTENGRTVVEAVLVMDLDGFKPVNDVYGHATGDKVLAAVARRIAGVAGDRALLARLGGDEFVAILNIENGDAARAEARAFAEQIRHAMQDPIEIEGSVYPVGASVGIAVVPEDAETLAGALVVADAALYEAKRMGRNRVVDQAPSLASEGHADSDGYLEGHWTSLGLAGFEIKNL
jgi:diguanylate cyclase (GGDEF)-like protein